MIVTSPSITFVCALCPTDMFFYKHDIHLTMKKDVAWHKNKTRRITVSFGLDNNGRTEKWKRVFSLNEKWNKYFHLSFLALKQMNQEFQKLGLLDEWCTNPPNLLDFNGGKDDINVKPKWKLLAISTSFYHAKFLSSYLYNFSDLPFPNINTSNWISAFEI